MNTYLEKLRILARRAHPDDTPRSIDCHVRRQALDGLSDPKARKDIHLKTDSYATATELLTYAGRREQYKDSQDTKAVKLSYPGARVAAVQGSEIGASSEEEPPDETVKIAGDIET